MTDLTSNLAATGLTQAATVSEALATNQPGSTSGRLHIERIPGIRDFLAWYHGVGKHELTAHLDQMYSGKDSDKPAPSSSCPIILSAQSPAYVSSSGCTEISGNAPQTTVSMLAKVDQSINVDANIKGLTVTSYPAPRHMNGDDWKKYMDMSIRYGIHLAGSGSNALTIQSTSDFLKELEVVADYTKMAVSSGKLNVKASLFFGIALNPYKLGHGITGEVDGQHVHFGYQYPITVDGLGPDNHNTSLTKTGNDTRLHACNGLNVLFTNTSPRDFKLNGKNEEEPEICRQGGHNSPIPLIIIGSAFACLFTGIGVFAYRINRQGQEAAAQEGVNVNNPGNVEPAAPVVAYQQQAGEQAVLENNSEVSMSEMSEGPVQPVQMVIIAMQHRSPSPSISSVSSLATTGRSESPSVLR